MKGGGVRPEVKTMHSLSYPPNLVPFRAKAMMNYTDYGGQLHIPKLSLEGGGQLCTPKLSLADAGGGPPLL